MPEAVVTRVPETLPPRKSRTLEERLMVRFPRAFQRQFAAAIRLLPRRSRLRRVLLRRAVVSGWASANRGDFDVMLVRYALTSRSLSTRRSSRSVSPGPIG